MNPSQATLDPNHEVLLFVIPQATQGDFEGETRVNLSGVKSYAIVAFGPTAGTITWSVTAPLTANGAASRTNVKVATGSHNFADGPLVVRDTDSPFLYISFAASAALTDVNADATVMFVKTSQGTR